MGREVSRIGASDRGEGSNDLGRAMTDQLLHGKGSGRQMLNDLLRRVSFLRHNPDLPGLRSSLTFTLAQICLGRSDKMHSCKYTHSVVLQVEQL